MNMAVHLVEGESSRVTRLSTWAENQVWYEYTQGLMRTSGLDICRVRDVFEVVAHFRHPADKQDISL